MGVSIIERAAGRWDEILPKLGFGSDWMRKKHGPCPMCGGKDRYRWGNKKGLGEYYCSGCGNGSGFDLLMKSFNQDFKTVVKKVEEIIGEAPPPKIKPKKENPYLQRKLMVSLWESGRTVQWDCPVGMYLSGRGIWRDHFHHLRSAMDVRFSGSPPMTFPAMLAKVISPEGKAVNIHRTFLTTDGEKAPVGNECKKLMSGMVPAGSAVRLSPVKDEMGIAEGIETALSASILFNIPVWSVLNANNLMKFVVPDGVKRLVIFSDNDASFTGQSASFALARELALKGKLQIEVMVPARSGEDWNDVLVRK